MISYQQGSVSNTQKNAQETIYYDVSKQRYTETCKFSIAICMITIPWKS